MIGKEKSIGEPHEKRNRFCSWILLLLLLLYVLQSKSDFCC